MANEIKVDVYHQIMKRHFGNDDVLRDYKMLPGPDAPIAAPFDRSYALNTRVRNETLYKEIYI